MTLTGPRLRGLEAGALLAGAFLARRFVPGVVTGSLSTKGSVADGTEGSTSDRNPWEAMGYTEGGRDSPSVALGSVWPAVLRVALAGVFVLLNWKVVSWAWS